MAHMPITYNLQDSDPLATGMHPEIRAAASIIRAWRDHAPHPHPALNIMLVHDAAFGDGRLVSAMRETVNLLLRHVNLVDQVTFTSVTAANGGAHRFLALRTVIVATPAAWSLLDSKEREKVVEWNRAQGHLLLADVLRGKAPTDALDKAVNERSVSELTLEEYHTRVGEQARTALRIAVAMCLAVDLVPTIELVPQQPLRMGNYDVKITTTPKRSGSSVKVLE